MSEPSRSVSANTTPAVVHADRDAPLLELIGIQLRFGGVVAINRRAGLLMIRADAGMVGASSAASAVAAARPGRSSGGSLSPQYR